MRYGWVAVVAVAVVVRGCAATARAAIEPVSRELGPLSSPSPLIDLTVPDHRAAVLSLPLGSTSRRPVIVAAHGAGDRPEWQCGLWRRLVRNRAFVLCPRGSAIYPHGPETETDYYYREHSALGREIALALDALARRFPDRVDLARPVFAGYSQGAIMGALILPDHPAGFARAVLIEGGCGQYQEWNVAVATRFHHHGGRRVVLACGRYGCLEHARAAARYLARGGLAVRAVYARGAGHSYGDSMEAELRAALPWLLEGDERW